MHIVITGGLGFIGSRIGRKLLELGHKVTLVDNGSTAAVEGVEGAKFVELDLLDGEAVRSVAIDPAECFMHLAGPSSGMASAKDPVGTVAKGYELTYNALELASKLQTERFLYASTMSVYGNVPPEDNPVSEDFLCAPVSHYGIGKYANERLVEVYCTEKGINFNSLRMFNVYGPGQDLSRMDQGIVSIFLALLMKSPKMISKGSLERFRDIVHIEDIVKAWVLCGTGNAKSGVYNVGSGVAITIGEMIKNLGESLGISENLEIEVEQSGPGDIMGISADITALNEAIGFTPDFPPKKGIHHFTEWALESRG